MTKGIGKTKHERRKVVLGVVHPLLCSMFALPCLAQQPQTNDVANTQPLYSVNAKYVQGVGPGYWPTKGSGLTLNLSAGTAICGNPPAKVTYAGGTLTMTASQTNYVYLNPAASCVPASNTTGFPVGAIPKAVVTTGGSAITGVTDVRGWDVDPNGHGPVMRADLKPGADACAKIQNAINDLPNYTGIVDARGFTGTQTCAGGISVNFGALQFSDLVILLGNSILVVNAPLSFTADSLYVNLVAIQGVPGMGDWPPTTIQEANGANLSAVVDIHKVEADLRNLYIEGNKANQTCPSPPCNGIHLFDSYGAIIDRVNVWSAFTNNVQLESTSVENSYSAMCRIVGLLSADAGGAALQIKNTQDTVIIHSGMEGSNIGAELIDASNARFTGDDFGGNNTYGFKLTCTSVRDGANGTIITGGQFGANKQGAIFIDGWNGSASCNGGNLITGMQIPSSGLSANNTYSAIVIKDSGNNTVTGNSILYQNGQPNYFKYGIELRNTNGVEGPDTITGNHIGATGTAPCVILANTTSAGNDGCPNQFPTTLAVAYTGAAGLTLTGSTQSSMVLKNAAGATKFTVGRSVASDDAQNFFVYDNAASATRLLLDSNGLLGIATSGPQTILDINGDRMRIRTAHTPSSSTESCYQGSVIWDASYIYVCTASNTWKRVALLAF